MKKLLLSTAALAMAFNLYAYELNGPLEVKWTGFKTEDKVPVSGSFKDISLDIGSSKDLTEFLKSAKVNIESISFDSGNPFRDNNITSTLFSMASAKVIKGTISKVNPKTKILMLAVTMNEKTKEVLMYYRVTEDKIIAAGTLDVLDFGMKESYAEFAKKCAGFHENVSFSEVDIEFSIPFK